MEVRLNAASASAPGTPATRRPTFRKDRRLNIRLSSKDLEAIQDRRSRRGCHTSR